MLLEPAGGSVHAASIASVIVTQLGPYGGEDGGGGSGEGEGIDGGGEGDGGDGDGGGGDGVPEVLTVVP